MTYSIIARDGQTGQIGIAVQSHWFAVGRIVPWARAGVGGVAIQANGDPSYGTRGLDLMGQGHTAAQAVASLTGSDAREEVTQVAMVDAAGGVGNHTGARCFAEAGHIAGEGWSVQANLMARRTVPEAMASAYTAADASLAFVDRLLAALHAAEAQGGDLRGRQSACVLIVEGSSEARLPALCDVVVDVRVDDDPEPLPELSRLVKLALAYRENEIGLALSETDFGLALSHWERAAELAPGKEELVFWRAIALAEAGRLNEARLTLAPAVRESEAWRVLLRRMTNSGLLKVGRGLRTLVDEGATLAASDPFESDNGE